MVVARRIHQGIPKYIALTVLYVKVFLLPITSLMRYYIRFLRLPWKPRRWGVMNL